MGSLQLSSAIGTQRFSSHCARERQVPWPRGVNLSPTLWRSKVSPLPSPPFPSEVGPIYPARGSGERCKLPQWGLGWSHSHQRFWCIFRVKERCRWHSRCTFETSKKTAFLYVFMKCSQIIVRVQAIEDPHNRIIVRVRTCWPSRDRRLWGQNRRGQDWTWQDRRTHKIVLFHIFGNKQISKNKRMFVQVIMTLG